MLKRMSNIELLRIMSIIGVIILHFNYNGALALVIKNSNMGGYRLLVFLESIGICAVDVFMIISGYFISDVRKIKGDKPVKLVLQVILIQCAFEIVRTIIKHESFSLISLIPNNYFVVFYVTVFLISPYLNCMLDKVEYISKFIFNMILVFSIYPLVADLLALLVNSCRGNLQDISNITRMGSLNGYTIVNFILMYLIGASIKRIEPDLKKYSTKKIAIMYGMCVLIIFICTSLSGNDGKQIFNSVSLSYANPIVILEAITIFLLFKRINLGCNTIINRMSKACFTVYLTHVIFLRYLISEKVLKHNGVIILAYVLVVAVVLYIIGFFISIVYSIFEDFLFNKVIKRRK